MDLISIPDLTTALGRTLNANESAVAPYFINVISDYITTYTGLKFEVIEESVRLRSDYYGTIDLPGGPIEEILEVRYYYGAEAVYDWDGLNQIFGLEPAVAVDIIYTHGYASPPADIKTVATQVVRRMLLAPEEQDAGSLFKYRVGDVEEWYTGTFGGMGRGMFNDFEKLILDNYRITATTYRVGFTHPDIPATSIPESDSALFE